jgi:hypothetical protein
MKTCAVISERDIWGVANLLIEWHGDRAFSIASRWAGRMLDRRDFANWHVWARIRRAVAMLQAPRRGEPN